MDVGSLLLFLAEECRWATLMKFNG